MLRKNSPDNSTVYNALEQDGEIPVINPLVDKYIRADESAATDEDIEIIIDEELDEEELEELNDRIYCSREEESELLSSSDHCLSTTEVIIDEVTDSNLTNLLEQLEIKESLLASFIDAEANITNGIEAQKKYKPEKKLETISLQQEIFQLQEKICIEVIILLDKDVTCNVPVYVFSSTIALVGALSFFTSIVLFFQTLYMVDYSQRQQDELPVVWAWGERAKGSCGEITDSHSNFSYDKYIRPNYERYAQEFRDSCENPNALTRGFENRPEISFCRNLITEYCTQKEMGNLYNTHFGFIIPGALFSILIFILANTRMCMQMTSENEKEISAYLTDTEIELVRNAVKLLDVRAEVNQHSVPLIFFKSSKIPRLISIFKNFQSDILDRQGAFNKSTENFKKKMAFMLFSTETANGTSLKNDLFDKIGRDGGNIPKRILLSAGLVKPRLS